MISRPRESRVRFWENRFAPLRPQGGRLQKVGYRLQCLRLLPFERLSTGRGNGAFAAIAGAAAVVGMPNS